MFWFYKNLTPFRFLYSLLKQTEMNIKDLKMLCSTADEIKSRLSPALTNIQRSIPTKSMCKCKITGSELPHMGEQLSYKITTYQYQRQTLQQITAYE